MTNINTDEPIAHVYAWLEHFIMTVPLPEYYCECCGVEEVDQEGYTCAECDGTDEDHDDFDQADDFEDGYVVRQMEAYERWKREY